MTRAQIIQLVRDRFAFNESLDEAIILRHMDYAQLFYEQGTGQFPPPWFVLAEDTTLTTVAATREVALPDGFLSLDDMWSASITVDGVTYPFDKENHNVLVADTDLTSARPEKFALAGDSILCYPIPDVAYTINFPCNITTTAVSTTEDSPWFTEFPLLLMEHTCYSIAMANRDTDAVKFAQGQLALHQSTYLRRVEGRKHTGQSYTMGG